MNWTPIIRYLTTVAVICVVILVASYILTR
jgi:hypothetical protein